MKIGVDISWMVGQYRGMGRFARQLVTPIADQLVALAPSGVSTEDWPCVSRGKSFFPWWEQVELPRLCRSEQLDYLLCPYNTGPLSSLGSTRVIAVVHDLIFLETWSNLPPSASPYQNLGRLYRRNIVPPFIRRADTIITVSNYSASRLAEKFPHVRNKVHVIPNAIDDSWFQPPINLENRLNYIFTVAGEQTSKNVPRLLEAFALSKLWADQHAELRIAGISDAWKKKFIAKARQLKIEDYVTFVGFVSDDALVDIYRHARAFILASTFEGFGIPLLEAMASGTPVATSNTTSMPEVVGPHAVMFNPFDVAQISASLQKVWTQTADRKMHAQAAIERAQTYSNRKVLKEAGDFWRNLK